MAGRPRELSPTAVLAALLLVVHTLLAGLSAGAHAAPLELDVFGNPLCLGEFGFQDGKAPGGQQPHRECCDFGCHAPAAATPAPDRAALHIAFGPSTLAAWRHAETAPCPRLDRASIRLRGPPQQV